MAKIIEKIKNLFKGKKKEGSNPQRKSLKQKRRQKNKNNLLGIKKCQKFI